LAKTNKLKANATRAKIEVSKIMLAEMQGKAVEFKKRTLDRIERNIKRTEGRYKRQKQAVEDGGAVISGSDSDE
jgi:hypothetical protein